MGASDQKNEQGSDGTEERGGGESSDAQFAKRLSARREIGFAGNRLQRLQAPLQELSDLHMSQNQARYAAPDPGKPTSRDTFGF